MSQEVIAVLITSGLGLAGAVVVALVNRSTREIKTQITGLRNENSTQHGESRAIITELLRTTSDTNTKVAVIENDLKHVREKVEANSAYIERRRQLLEAGKLIPDTP